MRAQWGCCALWVLAIPLTTACRAIVTLADDLGGVDASGPVADRGVPDQAVANTDDTEPQGETDSPSRDLLGDAAATQDEPGDAAATQDEPGDAATQDDTFLAMPDVSPSSSGAEPAGTGLDGAASLPGKGDVSVQSPADGGVDGPPDRDCGGAGDVRVAQLALAADRSCARLTDGTVRCWGATRGFPGGLLAATPVAGLTGVRSLSADTSTCALREDDTVMCWGHGRFYSGRAWLDGWAPARAPFPSGLADVGVGRGFACVRRTNGSVVCAGQNNVGQLGDGTTGSNASPVTVAMIEATQLAVGGNNACVRLLGGVVSCWGESFATPPILLPGLHGAADVRLSSDFACGRYSDRSVYCARAETSGGGGAWGILNVAEIDQLAMSSTSQYACGRRPDGSVLCWHSPRAVHCANPNEPLGSLWNPVPVPGLSHAIDVAVGESHACARLEDGRVQCWGDNTMGQLGDGTSATLVTPTLARATRGFRDAALGYLHACGVRHDGTVQCWGAARHEQPSANSGDSLRQVTIAGLVHVTQVVIAASHSCARRENGTVACWGGDDVLFGFGANAENVQPIDTAGVLDAVQLAAAGSIACAVLANGTVRCWEPGASDLAMTIQNLADVNQIAVTDSNLWARLNDGTVVVRGPFGDLQSPSPATFTPVAALFGAVKIDATPSNVCALSVDGRVNCLGAVFGRPLVDSNTAAVEIPGWIGALDLKVDAEGVCAIMADRSVQCSGATSRFMPDAEPAPGGLAFEVPGLGDVEQLVEHDGDWCARTRTGDLYCWGYNRNGRFGTGDLDCHTRPVDVVALP